MSIPIFTGKQKTYNRLMLETLLVEGELTAWQIAKMIEPQVNLPGDKYHKAQKIYSSLQRKGGRLEDLKAKRYITHNSENNKYRLTIKGLIAILLAKPQLKDLVNPIYHKIDESRVKFRSVKIRHLGVTVKINGKELERTVKRILKQASKDKKWLADFLEFGKSLQEELNFDNVSNDVLTFLLARLWMLKNQKQLPKDYQITYLNGDLSPT